MLPDFPLRMQVSVSNELFGDVIQEENNNSVGKSRAMAVEKNLLTNFYIISTLERCVIIIMWKKNSFDYWKGL